MRVLPTNYLLVTPNVPNDHVRSVVERVDVTTTDDED